MHKCLSMMPRSPDIIWDVERLIYRWDLPVGKTEVSIVPVKNPVLEPCTNRVTERFAICEDCEKIYGNKSSRFPEWLRFLWNTYQKEKRVRNRASRTEVHLEEVFYNV